jgi:NTE family protein
MDSERADNKDMLAGVGLALGGGVVYSIAGVGVYRAMTEAHVPIVAVSGTSGGAIVGAAVAAGLPGWELKQAAVGLRWGDLVRFSPDRMGLLNGSPIGRFVENITGCTLIEDLKMPFTAVATDINTGEEIRLDRGPLGFAVQASCSIPGLFQPAPYGNRLLVDGGVVDNLPVDAVKVYRPAVTVAVDVLTKSDEFTGRIRNGAFVVLKAYHIMVKRIGEEVEREADIILSPDVSGCSVMNFRHAGELIERGEKAGREIAPKLKEMLAERLEGDGRKGAWDLL